MALGKKKKAEADVVEAAKQDEAAAVAADADDEPEEVVTVPVAKPVYPDNMAMLRVVDDWKGSINGNVTHMAKGKVLNPRHYGGPVGIENLKKAGLKLKEVK